MDAFRSIFLMEYKSTALPVDNPDYPSWRALPRRSLTCCVHPDPLSIVLILSETQTGISPTQAPAGAFKVKGRSAHHGGGRERVFRRPHLHPGTLRYSTFAMHVSRDISNLLF
ncbi:hypothetical protein AVEN_53467-1 [Araneus ventricosus]|uniref:Uncharacterized protein n=1 Tax=Araneus ventricosus TaxID=182803 RepID=A0A4Y2AAE1_ARAVE|nr:hypothetical protein AVEN_53467-1 [Araneus ventricosus]